MLLQAHHMHFVIVRFFSIWRSANQPSKVIHITSHPTTEDVWRDCFSSSRKSFRISHIFNQLVPTCSFFINASYAPWAASCPSLVFVQAGELFVTCNKPIFRVTIIPFCWKTMKQCCCVCLSFGCLKSCLIYTVRWCCTFPHGWINPARIQIALRTLMPPGKFKMLCRVHSVVATAQDIIKQNGWLRCKGDVVDNLCIVINAATLAICIEFCAELITAIAISAAQMMANIRAMESVYASQFT